jgi:DnaK suppressor protein
MGAAPRAFKALAPLICVNGAGSGGGMLDSHKEGTMRNAEIRKAIAAELAARKEQLSREVREKVQESRALASESAPGEVVDGVDVSQSAVLAEVDRAEAERDMTELAMIEAAEGRLADGTYGYCVDCGVTIPVDRLRASPTATRCTACQTVAERPHH